MVELLQGLGVLQWVLVVAGILMVIPTARKFLAGLGKGGRLLGFAGGSSNNLTSIVHKWEVLNNACADAGLEDAQGKLREVFLVLANKRLVDPTPVPQKDDEEIQ